MKMKATHSKRFASCCIGVDGVISPLLGGVLFIIMWCCFNGGWSFFRMQNSIFICHLMHSGSTAVHDVDVLETRNNTI